MANPLAANPVVPGVSNGGATAPTAEQEAAPAASPQSPKKERKKGDPRAAMDAANKQKDKAQHKLALKTLDEDFNPRTDFFRVVRTAVVRTDVSVSKSPIKGFLRAGDVVMGFEWQDCASPARRLRRFLCFRALLPQACSYTLRTLVPTTWARTQ